MDISKFFNPAVHTGDQAYIAWWSVLFETLLVGVWAKILAVVALCLAGWFGVRSKNLPMMMVFLILAAFLAYGAALFR